MVFRAHPEHGLAWVTGASSGIGRATAIELARRGFTVAVTARRLAELETMVADAAGLKGAIVPCPGDVTDADAMADLVGMIERSHGPIALAFLNVGIAPYVRGDAIDLEAFGKAYEINVFGMLRSLAAIVPQMTARGRGQIAINASLAGYRGLPRAAAYASTKAALINLTEGLKFDFDRSGLTIQVVNPGFVETPLTGKNDFPMPFLMSMDEAARRIVNGFARGGFEIAFPRRFVAIMKLLRILPYPMYFWLVKRATGWR